MNGFALFGYFYVTGDFPQFAASQLNGRLWDKAAKNRFETSGSLGDMTHNVILPESYSMWDMCYTCFSREKLHTIQASLHIPAIGLPTAVLMRMDVENA